MQNAPWIVWILFMAGSFAVLEWYAFKHPKRENTLSRFMWQMGNKWRLIIYIYGVLTGGLAVHFWWNWNPACQAAGLGG